MYMNFSKPLSSVLYLFSLRQKACEFSGGSASKESVDVVTTVTWVQSLAQKLLHAKGMAKKKRKKRTENQCNLRAGFPKR